MPLDEREQRILEEIEAQFYQEDPGFAQAVRDTAFESLAVRRVRWAVVGFLAGLLVMLVFFTRSIYVAFGGFLLMVGSVAWIVTAVRRRQSAGSGSSGHWLERARQRWRRSS